MTHPQRETLERYLNGRLPPDEAATLDSHMETCVDCGRQLGEIQSDSLGDLLRQAAETIAEAPAPVDSEIPVALRNHSRYEVQDRLGRGGMGVVYRARHRMMNRPVALKLIRSDLLASPEAVERFRREVQAAAKLAHANIVTAYDAEEVDGTHFLVMEYVEGKTLDQVVKRRGPLSVPLACTLARQAALGLDHAHSRNMVHRDIKPHNLIVTAKGKLKILDFGLAQMNEADAGAGLTRERGALGTLLYAAPEQLYRHTAIDARADQYGLGATLLFLLTGEPPPLPSRPTAETLTFEGMAPLSVTIPDEVQAVIEKLMATSPEDRYPNVKTAAEALAPWCSSRSLEDDAPVWPRRLLIVAGVAMLAVLVLVAVLASRPGKRDVVEKGSASSIGSATNIGSATKVIQTPGWQSLMTRMNPARDIVGGTWTLVNGEWVAAAATGARIMLPAPEWVEYDLRIAFTRRTGRNSVGVIVIHPRGPVAFEVDAWGQNLAGFQNVNGQRITDNPSRHDGVALDNGRRYELVVEVRRGSLRATLDGVELSRLTTDGRTFTVDPMYWSLPDSGRMALLAWDSETVFHAVDVRPRP